MALQKTIALPSGVSGNYIRLSAYRWDRATREASAMFHLYKDAAQAANAPASPLCLIAKVRLFGAKFDEYLGNAVLGQPGVTVAGQLYEAAKNEPINAGGDLTILDLSEAADV